MQCSNRRWPSSWAHTPKIDSPSKTIGFGFEVVSWSSILDSWIFNVYLSRYVRIWLKPTNCNSHFTTTLNIITTIIHIVIFSISLLDTEAVERYSLVYVLHLQLLFHDYTTDYDSLITQVTCVHHNSPHKSYYHCVLCGSL